MRRPGIFFVCAVTLSAQSEAPPRPEEQVAIIGIARDNALRYTAGLPDFLCTQTVRRYTESKSEVPWKPQDTLEMSVAYSARGERYKLEKINGIPTNRSLDEAGGFQAHGEFGTMLRSIFRPEAAAEFKWQRWTTVRERRTHVYSFEIPKSLSAYVIDWGTSSKRSRITTGLGGEVYVDAGTRQVVRVISEAAEIPRNSAVHRSYGSLDYDYVRIAGVQFLLPTHVESNLEIKSGNRRNVSDFSDYRKFSGDATISFETQTPD
jgi:hypothetical protein